MTLRPFYGQGGPLSTGDYYAYVKRQADIELQKNIRAGQLCCVCNARQMGKTSMLNYARDSFQNEPYKFAFTNLTKIGDVSKDESYKWYEGFIRDINLELSFLSKDELSKFIAEFQGIPSIALLNEYLRTVCDYYSENIVIGIDEIDRVIDSAFDCKPLFEYINNTHFDSLSFVLIGVATPFELGDKTFNKSVFIDLSAIQSEEACSVLSKGFKGLVIDPEAVVKQVLLWTGGQPFLTQKACDFIQTKAKRDPNFIRMPLQELLLAVDAVIKHRIIDEGFEGELEIHLKSIEFLIF